MSKIKDLMQGVTSNFVYDIIKKILVSIFTSGISFPTAFMFLKSLSLPLWCAIVFSIAITALLLFVVMLIYQRISNKYVSSEKVDSNYDITEKTVKFSYDGVKSYYEAEISLRFNQKTREYYGKYYWSGSGEGEIRILNHGFSLNILKRRTRYIEYVVIFDKAYKKGKTLTIKLKGSMDDPAGTFSPYFATTIDVPTKKLNIILSIDPAKYPIKDLEREAVQPHRHDHEGCELVSLDCAGVYTWSIENPQLSYQYTLAWTFDS